MGDKLDLVNFAIANAQFTADVYQELIKSTVGNLLICPLSIEIILALTHAGAKGKTAEQLSDALYLPPTPEEIRKTFKNIEASFQKGSYTISSANKIYLRDGIAITNQFKKTALEDFFAEIENVDFGQTKQAALAINNWCAEKTQDKIQGIIEEEALSDSMCAILINAMYFNGLWSDPFEKDFTTKMPFYLNNSNDIAVDMMRQGSYFNYCEDRKLDAELLVMMYGMGASMTFVLPNTKDGLGELEKNLSNVLGKHKYNNVMVNVAIPKFKIATGTQLVPILEALGMVDAFGDHADFSGMVVNESLKIDQVTQKAFIDVHEEGTTAAVVTDVEIMVGCCENQPQPKEFKADHPFLFILKLEDIVFFIGRCVAPKYS